MFARGTGGAIFELDVPREGTMARERFDEQVAKGDLTILPSATWVERPDGSKYLVAGSDVPADAPAGEKKPRKPRAAKPSDAEGSADAPAGDADDPVGD